MGVWHMSSRVVTYGVLMAATTAFGLPALAADLSPYAGQGRVTVVNDGTVVLEFLDPAADAAALVVDDADQQYLISDGTTSSILAPGKPVPPETKTKVPLVGSDPSSGACAIGVFVGTVSFTQGSEGDWDLDVSSGGAPIFAYKFTDGGAATRAPSCHVECDHGSCDCNESLVCICFCGLFGEPWCISIIPLAKALSL